MRHVELLDLFGANPDVDYFFPGIKFNAKLVTAEVDQEVAEVDHVVADFVAKANTIGFSIFRFYSFKAPIQNHV